MENIYYVYIYLDPSKSGRYSYEGLEQSFLYEPFYVGKGKINRITSHLQDYRLKRKTHMSNKLNKMISEGLSPIILKLYDGLSESDSLSKEIEIISKIGIRNDNKGPLVNITYGGQGFSGLKHTEESRKKMSFKGENHPNWGKHLKESTRKKISERLKINNGMRNPEVSEKVRLNNLGREPWNKGKSETREDVIQKMSQKKIKYRNIKATSKSTGEIIEFDNTNQVISFMKKTHRMIMIYFERGESKDYYWQFDKD